ncbi:MAG: GTP cyclohydrolase II [Acidobacteria bacterium 13_1_20CM_2_55_15]|nr:MAG: GTP cyclohydrolase II [Acidobacteria bacterium 13_1_20CM_2_55_15]PYR68766.1 MAG: GTP cyclohydrolase II [Acidobacteriota bacterium]
MKTTKVAETSLPTPLGTFRLFGFQSEPKTENVLALVMGKPNPDEAALVRIHSQCLTGDVFGSERCDCGDQLHFALSTIAESGSGLLIYQLQEGRGIGLMNKLLAYELQDSGHDTVEANEHLGFEADHRNYDLCAGVLRHFGITRVRLMTNNPQKFDALEAAGIHVVERVPIEIPPSDGTKEYLKTKKAKLGHLLSNV